MYQFAASANGRYNIALHNNVLDYTLEGKRIWSEMLMYDEIQLMGAGNNGALTFLADGCIYVAYPSKERAHQRVNALSSEALTATESLLTKVLINESGTQLCAGLLKKDFGISGKIKDFFSVGNARKQKELHDVFFISLTTDKTRHYYTGDFSLDSAIKFQWDISHDFVWFTIAEPVKTLTAGNRIKVSLVKVQEWTIYNEYLLPHTALEALMVNNDGTILTAYMENGKKIIEIFKQDQSVYRLAVEADLSIECLSSYFVVFRKGKHTVLVYSFTGDTLCNTSMKPLADMHVPYQFKFFGNSNVNILQIVDGELKVVYSSLDQISIEAQRWSYLKKSQDEERRLKSAGEAISIREESYRRKKDMLKESMSSISTKDTAREQEAPLQPSEFFYGGDSSYDPNPVDYSLASSNIDWSDMLTRQTAERNRPSNRVIELTSAQTSPAAEAPPQEARNLYAAEREISEAVFYGGRESERENSDQAFTSLLSNSAQDEKITQDRERQRLERLIDTLEDRFVMGEITERTYRELKNKYIRKIKTS